MKLRARVAMLALSFVLPLLATGSLVLFTVGAVTLAASDRAIIWAESTPSRLNALEQRVRSNPWFGGGRAVDAGENAPLPTDCRPGARQFSFGGLREGEAQAAREILELIASEAGATVCVTNVFVINEPPDPARQNWTEVVSSWLLSTSLIPAAMVVAAYFSMAGALGLPQPIQQPSAKRRTLAIALLGALVAWISMSGLSAAAGWAGYEGPTTPAMSIELVGPGLALALMVVVPATMELAFRGWMLPLVERGTGTAPAVVSTAAVFAGANLPDDAWQAAGQFLLGLVLGTVYVRTRSLGACILASIALSVTAFFGL